MEEADFWRLVAKYLAGEASERELKGLKAWIATNPGRGDQLAEAERVWRAGKRGAPPPNVQAAWHRLENRIAKYEAGSKVLPKA